MSIDIAIHKIKYEKLIDCLLRKYPNNIKSDTENVKFLEKILLSFGEKIGDYYIILYNEYFERYNPLSQLTKFLDKYYNLENTFDFILNLTVEMISTVNHQEEAVELEIDLK